MSFRSPMHALVDVIGRQDDLPVIAAAADATRSALSALDDGRLDVARRLWASVDGDQLLALWDLQNELASRVELPWTKRALLRLSESSARKPDPVRPALRKAVFARDGYRCRYCEIPVVTRRRGEDIPRLVAAFPEVTPHLRVGTNSGVTNEAGKPLLSNAECSKWLWFAAVLDHVDPSSDGGRSSEDNLVTACGGCNYTKMQFTLEEMGVDDPRSARPR